MEGFLKNLGLILLLIGFIVLAISVFKGVSSNTMLLISLILVVGGLLTYIITNKYVY